MKKLLAFSIMAIAASAALHARKADRGALDGVTADDIRNGGPVATAPAGNAVKSETATIAIKKEEAKPAACPAAKCSEGFRVFPVFAGGSGEKCYTTQFGKDWAGIGMGGGGLFYTGSDSTQKLGGNAVAEISINAFSSADDKWGLNLAVPVAYEYISISSNDDMHRVNFPLMLRPYYRFFVSEDVVITPYLNCGAGGAYQYFKGDDMLGTSKDLAFLWIVGGGVEISFLKDFSFTPKYEWVNFEDNGNAYYQAGGAEFAWKFAKNMTVVADYSCRIYEMANLFSHIGLIKLRYDF